MLKTRLIVGTGLIAALAALAACDASFPYLWLGATRIGPGAVLLGVSLLFIAAVLAREFSRLTSCSRQSAVWLTYFAIAGGIASIALAPTLLPRHLVAQAIVSIPCLLVIFGSIDHARSKQVTGLTSALGALLLAYAAIGVPLGFWILLRHDRDAWTLAGAVLAVKSADIGAYFTGLAIGKHKLAPWLSPAKTWEGFAGGVILSGIVGSLLAIASQSNAAADACIEPLSLSAGVFIAIALGVAGTCGDLFESALKRGAGVKDSGTILPGMGGLYDLFDSILPAGPLAWWLIAS